MKRTKNLTKRRRNVEVKMKSRYLSDDLQTFIKNMNSKTTSFGLHDIDISTDHMPYHSKFVSSTILLDLSCPGATSFWQSLNLEYLLTNKIILVNVGTSLYKMIPEQKGLGSVSEVYLIEQDDSKRIEVKKGTEINFSLNSYSSFLRKS